MADLIERRDALNMHFSHGINNDGVLYVPFREVMDNLKALPSAQPELGKNTMPEQPQMDKLGVKTGETCTDVISRQAVMDTIAESALDLNDPDENWIMQDRIKEIPSAQPEIKPISYDDCANAMLKMWMDNVLTDGEYNRIMDKLNKFEAERRTDG